MLLDLVALFLLVSGLFFFFIGVVGLFRFPDAYTRLHATTKCDTLGCGLVLLSLMLYQGFSGPSVKIGLMILFIWLSNPTAAHAIAKAAYSVDIPMVRKAEHFEHAKEEST